MSTLKALRDQLVIDAGVEGDPKFPITRLNRMIALAERYVQTELNTYGLKKFEKFATITGADLVSAAFNKATSNVKTVAISTVITDLLETPSSILFIECDFLLSPSTHAYSLAYEVDKDKFKESLNNSLLAPTKKNPIFMRLDNQIWIAPLADGSYNLNSITPYYYKRVTDISAIVSPATDAEDNLTEIPAEFEEYIVKKAKLEIDVILEKVQNRQSIANQLQQEIQSANQKFINKQVEMNRANTRDIKTKMQ